MIGKSPFMAIEFQQLRAASDLECMNRDYTTSTMVH